HAERAGPVLLGAEQTGGGPPVPGGGDPSGTGCRETLRGRAGKKVIRCQLSPTRQRGRERPPRWRVGLRTRRPSSRGIILLFPSPGGLHGYRTETFAAAGERR